MNVLDDIARTASYQGGYVILRMKSGVEIRFPVSNNPRLEKGNENQLSNIKITLYGLHWPDLDEDLSFQGLLKGDYGRSRSIP